MQNLKKISGSLTQIKIQRKTFLFKKLYRSDTRHKPARAEEFKISWKTRRNIWEQPPPPSPFFAGFAYQTDFPHILQSSLKANTRKRFPAFDPNPFYLFFSRFFFM